MPANMTLHIAQSLYGRHKSITYPHTDSRTLTKDYVPTRYKIFEAVNDEHKIFAHHIIENTAINGSNKKISMISKFPITSQLCPLNECQKTYRRKNIQSTI
jgi:DNA topoisomerase IA